MYLAVTQHSVVTTRIHTHQHECILYWICLAFVRVCESCAFRFVECSIDDSTLPQHAAERKVLCQCVCVYSNERPFSQSRHLLIPSNSIRIHDWTRSPRKHRRHIDCCLVSNICASQWHQSHGTPSIWWIWIDSNSRMPMALALLYIADAMDMPNHKTLNLEFLFYLSEKNNYIIDVCRR